MLFIPTFEDIVEEELIIYCVIFTKPYNFTIARSFMNLYHYTCAHMVETESWIIFYQSKDYISFVTDWNSFTGISTDEIILEDMKKIDEFSPKCMSFFDDKVTLLLFKEPFWLI